MSSEADSPVKFVILAVLDGWGLTPSGPGNAISLAKTPNMYRFAASYPHTQLIASGQAVGLPRGEEGNTETGHLNLGAGMIIYQALERINMSIADGSFFQNKILLGAIEHAKKHNSNLHLMGLVGAGGVHSNIEHLFALIHLAKENNFNNLYLHIFTDGRDTAPTAARIYISKVEEVLAKERVGQIASVMGRYWAMDRDQRWERTAKAYHALTSGQGRMAKDPKKVIGLSYQEGKTDEFIEPFLIDRGDGETVALIKDNDAVIFFNFRIDRPRQLTKAFLLQNTQDFTSSDFDPHRVKYEHKHLTSQSPKSSHLSFNRGRALSNLYFVTMTEYGKPLVRAGAKVAFPPRVVDMPLGRVISMNGLSQLRMTESEKERFVTFYFNGLREEPFPREEWVIIPSPNVPTYDQKPEMSSAELTKTLLSKISTLDYKFILVNFPNVDMVGHTGNINPTIKAVEAVDAALGKIANFALAYQGALIITADHGNAEEMIDPKTGQIDTEHSTNPVPFIIVSKKFLGKPKTLTSGILADVAPTILTLLNIPVPTNMTGKNLLEEIGEQRITQV